MTQHITFKVSVLVIYRTVAGLLLTVFLAGISGCKQPPPDQPEVLDERKDELDKPKNDAPRPKDDLAVQLANQSEQLRRTARRQRPALEHGATATSSELGLSNDNS